MRGVAAILFACCLTCFSPQALSAATCDFRTRGLAVLDDFDIARTLRCLVIELDKLKRENAALRRRLDQMDDILVEVPADYSNVDGIVSREEGRAIGRASFVLSARSTGGPNALPVDQTVLEEVCGRNGGCSVLLGFRRTSLFDTEPRYAHLTGPCQFSYSAGRGAWSLGAGCGDAPKSGTDGDETASSAGRSDPVIVEAAGACLFSESAPAQSVGQGDSFTRDHRIGLFLVAMPARQTDGIRRFQCELVLN